MADSWDCGGRFVGGQREAREERTARRTLGGEEDSGRCRRGGQRGGHREGKTATMVDIKQGSITFKTEFFNKKGRIYLKRSSLKGSFFI